MKKIIYVNLLFLLGLNTVLGQMAGPTASTYFADRDRFYIACNTGKNIVELQRDGTQKVFITGLTSPNNIYYGNFPLAEGFAVLDSNVVKLYDTSGAYVGTETITGAKKLTDAAIDEVTGGVQTVYTCDVLRGVIYKTTFPAPFYFPSTSIWVTGLNHPASLLVQPSKGRLLYTEDSANARIMAIDLATKAVSSVFSTGVGNVVGLAEDGQGNLYFSSQGAAYIYQINKYLSGSPKKIISEPKPGDLTILPSSDDLVYTCIKCGTVFISKIHNFGPGNELMVCPKDSVFSYNNISFKNFGTFDAANEFLLKYTVLSGNLSSGTVIGRFKDTVVPAEIKGKLPNNLKPGNYKVFWESTKPKIARTWNTLEVYNLPIADLFIADTAAGCNGSKVDLGLNNNSDTTAVHYDWKATYSNLNFHTSSHQFTIGVDEWIKLIATDKTTSCKNQDSVFLVKLTSPTLSNWKDSLKSCENAKINLGQAPVNLYKYRWIGPNLGSDSLTSNPEVVAKSSADYKLEVSILGCSKNYAVNLKVVSKPSVVLSNPDSVFFCQYANVGGQNKINYLSPGAKFKWEPYTGFTLETNGNLNLEQLSPGRRKYWLKDEFGCQDSGSFYVTMHTNDIFISKRGDTMFCSNFNKYNSIKWYKYMQSPVLAQDAQSLVRQDTGIFVVCGDRKGTDCSFCDSFYFEASKKTNGLYKTKRSVISGYPNPVKSGENFMLNIDEKASWKLYDIRGMEMKSGATKIISTEGLAVGIYVIKIEGSVQIQTGKLYVE